ncbi:hypothetical protein [Massilibacteroides sp.]|uniref:hypothetical protein n=1 Tax=Massilibacteroides sp. TaxID=2034766 RepID=UPI00261BA6CE|nr:hypothetical protein [Massilibacteroides sp.]MDD4515683.1 hypothetical protein [Massilibacteroides sp.]
MKDKITEIENYFKNKLLSGEFKIISINEYTLELIIDCEYTFNIWIGNYNIPETRKIYKSMISFMNIELTDTQAKKLHYILSPEIRKYKNEILLEQKKKELEKLQKEINNQI